MGSSLSHGEWIAATVVSGVFYLLFDAIRHFAQQVSPVQLRRWRGDPGLERGSRWFSYDPRNLQLMSGALLQISLILAIGSTVMFLQPRPVGIAVATAALAWLAISVVWKFALALIPDDVSEIILKHMIPFSHFFYYLFWPVLFPMRRMFARLDKQEQEEAEAETVTDEEVQAFIDVGEEGGIIGPSEGKMIASVVEFGDRIARELMTPRIDMVTFDARKSFEDLVQLFSASKYSRIPTYQESVDAITGIVHIKDIFESIVRKETKTIVELARPPYFVPETKKVSELLREFQSEHMQLAVVVDEFGGTAGLITIEDIVEDIVGEIADEHEEVEATVVDLGNDEYLVSGLLPIDTLEEMLDAHFDGEDYETVAGMIFTTLGRIPKAGTVVTKNGYRFEVDRADRRRIYRVKITRDPEWQEIGEESVS